MIVDAILEDYCNISRPVTVQESPTVTSVNRHFFRHTLLRPK